VSDTAVERQIAWERCEPEPRSSWARHGAV